jgi:hypothetical protein
MCFEHGDCTLVANDDGRVPRIGAWSIGAQALVTALREPSAESRPEVGQATRPMSAAPPPPSRRHRRLARRRLVREQAIVLLVLLVLLAVTVLLLCLEWLNSGTVGPNTPSIAHSIGGT